VTVRGIGAMIRRPAVAGQFYPADRDRLRRELGEMIGERRSPSDPRGMALLAPHAGYIYSGGVAAAVFTAVRLSRRVVILGPNHTGAGESVAIMSEGSWRLPMGDAPIDRPLAGALLKRCSAARVDEEAHRWEHSLEVQVPWLQYLLGDFSFVPVCVGTHHLPTLLDLGRAVAGAVEEVGDETLLVLSSDMSHYLPARKAGELDTIAIERILAIDPEGLHRVVRDNDISMCGMAPAVAGLEAARRLGAKSARLVAYANSGDRSGDYGSVVGYAGIALT